MSPKKPKGAENEGDGVESTNTESIQTESFTGSHLGPSAEYLGEAALRLPSQPRVLLRTVRSPLHTEISKELSLADFSLTLIHNQQTCPLVVGPLDLEKVRTWAMSGFLHHTDTVLTGFGRWKPLKSVFPELRGSSPGRDEITDTATFENAASLSPEILALEDIGSDEVVAPSLEAALDYSRMSPAARTEVRPAPPAAAPPQVSRPVPIALLALGSVLLLAGIVTLYRTKVALRDGAFSWASASKELQEKKIRDWPAILRPLGKEALYSDDGSPLFERLRPILQAYEHGATVLSTVDERSLRGIADPASASWEARRLAANQLMVFYLAKSRLADARKVLQPIIDATTSDPVTLLNDALLKFAEGNLSEAREAASVAVRLAPPGMLWIAYSVLGLIQGAAGRADEFEKSFENALAHSANNPFIYGMWIQSLLKSESPQRRSKIPHLLREALWSDPDRLVDSPIRAPIAGHLLKAEALSGLKKGADLMAANLSQGQQAYIRWLDAKSWFNPLGESLSRATELLSRDAAAQSQLLYAYLLNEQNKVDQASEVMSRVIPLLEGQKIASSWPWTFAGDIQNARGQRDQALIFYQAALSRNPQDPSAALGLALALREGGDFKAAEQKLAESLSVDPLFIPALLRVNRFDWHRTAVSE